MRILITEGQYKMVNDLILFQTLEHAITQFKRWHHYTQGYAEHMALGDFYEKLGEFQDEIMEVFIGINGRNVNTDFGMKFNKYSKGIATQYLTTFVNKMYQLKEQIPQGDLQNLIDEIAALANKTKYLLTLS